MKSSIHKKDKWEIPKDWEVKELKDLGTFKKGKGILKDQVINSGLPCIRYGEIYTSYNYSVKRFNSFISISTSKESQEIKHGDILFAGSGETIDEIGKAVAYVGDEIAFAGGDIIILRSNSNANSIYLSFLLESDFLKRQKRYLGQGHSVVHIYPSDLAKLKIPLPPLPEQNSIAACLSTWDRAIQTTDALIAQKEQCKKWLMQMLLTGKMRLKGFSGEWKVVRLIEVAEVDKYSLSSNTSPEYSFQYLSLSDVDSGVADIKSEIIMYKDSPSRARRIVQKGDILLATVRPNLQAFLIIRDDVKDFIASTGFAVITCTTIFNEFLYQYLYSSDFMRQIEALLTGSNYPAINSSDVKHLKIPFPLLEEQTAIAQVLQTADKEITLLRAKADKLREQKKGMMQVFLTGRVRMKGN